MVVESLIKSILLRFDHVFTFKQKEFEDFKLNSENEIKHIEQTIN